MDKKLGELIDIRRLKDTEIVEYPKPAKNVLVEKKKWYNKFIFTPLVFILTLGMIRLKGKRLVNSELVQPLLFLIKEDGYLDVIEGVKPGLFIVNIKGTNKQKGILLSADKLKTLNIEPYPKVWTAYENEMTPYPIDVYHDGEEMLSIIRKVIINRDLLKDDPKMWTAKMWFWLAIIGGIIVFFYFGMREGWFTQILNTLGFGK